MRMWISARRRRKAALCLAPALLACAGLLAAQARLPVPLTPPPSGTVPSNLQPDAVSPAASDTYRVGVDDLLDIFVYDMPDMTRQVRVDARGRIALPFLATPVRVLGMTTPEIASIVAARLVRAQLARNPYVQVVVRQVSSHLLVITGAVQQPGVIEASRPLSLPEAVARGGGLASDAGDTVRVTRSSAAGTPTTRDYRLQPILDGSAPGPELTGNETVEVEPAKLVYVIGSVNKPGAFPLRAAQPITLIRALALAAGIKDPADQKHAHLIRHGKDTIVDLKAVMALHAPDVRLQSGDILYVPESGRDKALGVALSSGIQTVVLMVGYNATHIF